MGLSKSGDIVYRKELIAGCRYQKSPPVCNACERLVTAENLGWQYLELADKNGPPGQDHIVLCVECVNPPQHADQRSRERFRDVYGV